jgi:hypothetical protein
MFLKVTGVTYLDDYRLRLQFNDGTVREVDLQSDLYGEVFEPLLDMALFGQARLNPDSGTVEWPNGADLAPEYLHNIGKEVRKIA